MTCHGLACINADCSCRLKEEKMTPREFAKRLQKFPKVEQEFILHQRQVLGIDKSTPTEG